MRTMISSLALLGLVFGAAFPANCGTWNAHRLDGRTIEYSYLDSVVTVLFAEDVSLEAARNLALAQNALRDDYMPWMLSDKLFVFGVEPNAGCPCHVSLTRVP